jgi:hypothetical protein
MNMLTPSEGLKAAATRQLIFSEFEVQIKNGTVWLGGFHYRNGFGTTFITV